MDDSCYVEPVKKSVSPVDYEEARMVMLAVDGMGCPNCATRIRNSLIRLDGVLETHVYHNLQLAEVVFDPRSTNPTDFVRAVLTAGDDGRHAYQARVILR
jgi:copper chaperone CopZ